MGLDQVKASKLYITVVLSLNYDLEMQDFYKDLRSVSAAMKADCTLDSISTASRLN